MFGRSRVLIGVAVAAMALAGLAGCSEDPVAAPKPTPTGPTVLTFAVYGPAPVVAAYTRIAADFTAAHPDIVVNVRPYANHAEAKAALDEQLASGNPPDASLTALEDLETLVDNKSIQRIDELLGEREVDFGDGFQRDALEAFSSDNALQCMPVDISPLVVYYNTALVDLAALTEPGDKPMTAESGWNLETFTQAAQNASGGRNRGVYIAADLHEVAPFIWSGGGHVTDDLEDPKSLAFAASSTQSALEELLEVVRNPQITFNAQQLKRRSALDRFKAGTLAMMLGYRSLTPELRAQQGLAFDVMPLPKIGSKATSGDSKGLCLSASTEHPEETADFLAHVVSAEPMTELAETGYVVPTNLAVANSDSFLQPTAAPVSSHIFVNGVRNIWTFPSTETWPSVMARAATLLHGLFYDPVIDPLDERLRAIDAASVPLFTPLPTATPTPTDGGSTTPTPSPGATLSQEPKIKPSVQPSPAAG